MIVFIASDYYRRFATSLRKDNANVVIGKCEIKRFPNGEMNAKVFDEVKDEDCLVIGSVAPPDEQLLSLLMLADALKRGGAHSVQAFLPYLGYARQDKFGPGESRGINLIGTLLRTAGVDQIISIDVHSNLDKQLIGLPLTALSPAQLFVPAVQELGWDDITVVAPDEGAIARAKAVAAAINSTHEVPHLVKKHVDGIMHLNLVGNVSARAVIVDDIIDSGRTLVSACNVLRDKGVQEVAVVVTHGLFTGSAWKRLFGLGVKTLLTSDSCPEAKLQKHKSVHVISLKPLLPAILSGAAIKENQYESTIT